MTKSYSNFMRSKFFTPAFNSAIFDGPIRIYFAQFNEQEALKIYFAIQDYLVVKSAKLKGLARGRNVFVLLYPNSDTFHMSFAEGANPIRHEALVDDEIIGICGPDSEVEPIFEQINSIVSDWQYEENAEPVVYESAGI